MGIAVLLAIAVGSRGIVTGLVWFASRNAISCLCAGLQDGSGGSSRRRTGRANDLNVALRKEILFYTTFGIRKSVKYAGRFPRCDRTGGVNPNSATARREGLGKVGIHYNRILLTREFEAGSWTRQRRGAGDHGRRGGGRGRGRAGRGEDGGSASSAATIVPKIEARGETARLTGVSSSSGARGGADRQATLRAVRVSESHDARHSHGGIGQLVRRGSGTVSGSYVPPAMGGVSELSNGQERTRGAGRAGRGARSSAIAYIKQGPRSRRRRQARGVAKLAGAAVRAGQHVAKTIGSQMGSMRSAAGAPTRTDSGTFSLEQKRGEYQPPRGA